MTKTDTDTRGDWDAMHAAEEHGRRDGTTHQTGRAGYKYPTEAERCAYLKGFHSAKAEGHARSASEFDAKALDAIQSEGGERLREELTTTPSKETDQ